jgi:hypothetical protein
MADSSFGPDIGDFSFDSDSSSDSNSMELESDDKNVQFSNPPSDGISASGDVDPENLEGLLPIGESF